MKTLILSNWSSKIAELNQITEINKHEYANLHSYDFENLKLDYTDVNHVAFLVHLLQRVAQYDVVLTIGCDAIFANLSIKIEDKIPSRVIGDKISGKIVMQFMDNRVTLAKDLTCCWPIQINNDVMLWPNRIPAKGLIERLIKDAPIWLKYPQLWQCHLWNLIQGEFKDVVRLVDPREMNSTFQPMVRSVDTAEDGTKSTRLTRQPGASSYALGDWIFHALDMPLADKIHVIKWAMQYVGDGSWKPNIDTRGTLV